MFTLIDGVAGNRAYPDTFEIPTEEERMQLVPGSYVVVGFEFEEGGERMWVGVDAVIDDGYRGTLLNHPVLTDELRYGSSVRFGPDHVLTVQPPDPPHAHCESTVCIEVDASDPAQRDCPKRVDPEIRARALGGGLMDDHEVLEALDEYAEAVPELGIPSEVEALSWAARERGDEAAGHLADELADQARHHEERADDQQRPRRNAERVVRGRAAG